MKSHYITWWNLENLFDIDKSPRRPEWLQKKLKDELKGWSETVLEKKLVQLAKVINKINSGKGPDILGVCEVENEFVLQRLVKKLKRKYAVAHHDSSDQRGIDVAFFFDAEKYELVGQLFSLEIMKREATRDIVQIQLRTKKSKQDFILLGNHWPARIPGQYETEPFRMMVAETLSYWLERIPVKTQKNIPIVVMGDFNDEPFDRSLTEYALSVREISKVKSERSERLYLFNLMWLLMNKPNGSYFLDTEPLMLDQILVTRSLVAENNYFQIDLNSTRIEILETIRNANKNGSPKRFGRPSKKGYKGDGFSDHFPVSVVMNEK